MGSPGSAITAQLAAAIFGVGPVTTGCDGSERGGGGVTATALGVSGCVACGGTGASVAVRRELQAHVIASRQSINPSTTTLRPSPATSFAHDSQDLDQQSG
jgi:hypothetical protein